MPRNEATSYNSVDFAVCKIIWKNVGFFIKNPSRAFWMKHRTSSAVSSKYFDTFIYTFIAIYKSLKILIHTVFSLLPYSVPYKFYSKNCLCYIIVKKWHLDKWKYQKNVIFSASKENRHYNMYGEKKPRLAVSRGLN